MRSFRLKRGRAVTSAAEIDRNWGLRRYRRPSATARQTKRVAQTTVADGDQPERVGVDETPSSRRRSATGEQSSARRGESRTLAT